tara:strand:- start:92 stop:607 length:516 start_codon:yes stop_codon:yes gene_type:complete
MKDHLKTAYNAMKSLDKVSTGQTIKNEKGDNVTVTPSDNKKILAAMRKVEDLYRDIIGGEIKDKEDSKKEDVVAANEQSEGHGEMYNALKGVREEGRVIKMSESTLKSVVERVIKEQEQIINKKPITEENVKITQATMERYMDVKFRELKDQNFVHLQRLTGLIEDNGCNK